MRRRPRSPPTEGSWDQPASPVRTVPSPRTDGSSASTGTRGREPSPKSSWLQPDREAVPRSVPQVPCPDVDVVHGFEALPIGQGPTAVTIGFFDGVHRGHQAILRRTVEIGRGCGIAPVAVTFDRHPREILTPGSEPPLLTTPERKAELIAALGLDALVVLEFTRDFSTWSPREFV